MILLTQRHLSSLTTLGKMLDKVWISLVAIRLSTMSSVTAPRQWYNPERGETFPPKDAADGVTAPRQWYNPERGETFPPKDAADGVTAPHQWYNPPEPGETFPPEESADEDTRHWHYDQQDTHPCDRPCFEGKPMICRYTFTVEKFYAMSKACYDCPQKLSDCYREDCIIADGFGRTVHTVNRKIPGPSIVACLGDKVVVKVVNKMVDESTSIHWHGHHQRGSPYMDGVPFITQCPISPLSTFVYTMNASNPGTQFWHAHTGFQRTDGIFGAFIVRMPDSKNYHRKLYDKDLSRHTILINDWTHQTGGQKHTSYLMGRGSNAADVLLVNGRGRYYNDTKRMTDTPLAVFTVQKGLCYRFRLINSGFMNCPTEMRIENHNLTFIATDAFDFEPVKADSLISYAGERWDFVLCATQAVRNYWIHFRGKMSCASTRAHQVAVLHYVGAPVLEPEGPVGYNMGPNYTMQINPLNVAETEPNTIYLTELVSCNKVRSRLLAKEPDMKIIMHYDFNPVDHSYPHKHGVYGHYQVNSTYRRFTPQFNYITFKWPKCPLLSQHSDISQESFCYSQNLTECSKKFCECTNVMHIPLNVIVELILIDIGKHFDANHAFHKHGSPFCVVGMDRLGTETSVHAVKSLDKQGKLTRNLAFPLYKDTVTVPDGGYCIIRFEADDPGYWLFHCHIENHMEEGMALVLKVGEHEDLRPPPKNFPKCGDFYP